MPRAPATQIMVGGGGLGVFGAVHTAAAAAAIMISPYSTSPPANCSRAFHATVPEPVRSPLCQPFSIGPPDSTIAGILTVAAAIRQAGVVLSQPVVRTTPSRG